MVPAVLWQALLLLSAASAQNLTPLDAAPNSTIHPPDDGLLLGIWRQQQQQQQQQQQPGHSGQPAAVFPVRPLTNAAAQDTVSTALSGGIILANNQNSLAIRAAAVALISCDPSTSNLGPEEVFNAARAQDATAVVLYSTSAQTCNISDSGTYQNIFTLESSDNSQEMLSVAADTQAWAVLGTRQAIDNGTAGGSSHSNNSSNASNPLGPSPSTAVAMIILYSITGVITALFLCIIITGAIRAHRHPERYGPRNVIGRPRQTRARGLARAMLDSLPIVKVGDRTAGEQTIAKPSEVELENGQRGATEYVGDQTTTARGTTDTAGDGSENNIAQEGNGPSSSTGVAASGIAPAANTAQRCASTPPDETLNQGCSICTEDFEVGEDQRVLPCDHRFHPACIDPWLLNVSGTCPLCRIDLRPPEATEDFEVDEHGNPIARDGNREGLAPPLEPVEGSRGARVRRSIMLGILGVARPERMSREERVAALRRYRENAAATADAQRQASVTSGTRAEEETSRRRRYRDLFRIRTRRTGEPEAVTEEPAPDVAANASTTNEARTT
ncbi:Receptor-like proteiny region, transmembrane domain- and RING domain-containing protein 3 [Cercospora zeina]